MSGDWAWNQVVHQSLHSLHLTHWPTSQDDIEKNKEAYGAVFVPIILGSNNTTVSVVMEKNDYWLVYLSIGNVHNNVQHTHHNAVALIAFLAIPKAAKKYTDNPVFQKFQKQLFHATMSRILQSLKPTMTTHQVMCCPDGHFGHMIFGIGPYITDYPEQVLSSGTVQGWCGR
ncbi:hypothetical protein PAXRUDRAFT_168379 [Paxillus rubicundulus Ve08.2h10]|uniref:Uncharacterized protein n=1 Tax=Paxillus rubicundulus Ve08.2h10 TaxID=930991 RepID=A0A0D0D946_9AGAM|nr:hypothetical protein PAXRUDRAFT_168379 [Paxillus rubicundulus Ve08.2h10]